MTETSVIDIHMSLLIQSFNKTVFYRELKNKKEKGLQMLETFERKF